MSICSFVEHQKWLSIRYGCVIYCWKVIYVVGDQLQFLVISNGWWQAKLTKPRAMSKPLLSTSIFICPSDYSSFLAKQLKHMPSTMRNRVFHKNGSGGGSTAPPPFPAPFIGRAPGVGKTSDSWGSSLYQLMSTYQHLQ